MGYVQGASFQSAFSLDGAITKSGLAVVFLFLYTSTSYGLCAPILGAK